MHEGDSPCVQSSKKSVGVVQTSMTSQVAANA